MWMDAYLQEIMLLEHFTHADAAAARRHQLRQACPPRPGRVRAWLARRLGQLALRSGAWRPRPAR